MVTVFFWNKGTDNRRWNVKRYYHVEHEGHHCWDEQGLDHLKMAPYVEPSRHHSKFEPTIRRQRQLILKRKAALDQDKRQLNKLADNYLDRCTVIDNKILQLVVEISQYGGVPISWAEELLK